MCARLREEERLGKTTAGPDAGAKEHLSTCMFVWDQVMTVLVLIGREGGGGGRGERVGDRDEARPQQLLTPVPKGDTRTCI